MNITELPIGPHFRFVTGDSTIYVRLNKDYYCTLAAIQSWARISHFKVEYFQFPNELAKDCPVELVS